MRLQVEEKNGKAMLMEYAGTRHHSLAVFPNPMHQHDGAPAGDGAWNPPAMQRRTRCGRDLYRFGTEQSRWRRSDRSRSR